MQVGQKTGIDIAGEPDPYVPVPGSPKWSGISMPWVSYGYEVQLTPLQTLSLYNAVAHDGVYLQPHILEQVRQGGEVVERVAPKSRGKIASDKTSRSCRIFCAEWWKTATVRRTGLVTIPTCGWPENGYRAVQLRPGRADAVHGVLCRVFPA